MRTARARPWPFLTSATCCRQEAKTPPTARATLKQETISLNTLRGPVLPLALPLAALFRLERRPGSCLLRPPASPAARKPHSPGIRLAGHFQRASAALPGAHAVPCAASCRSFLGLVPAAGSLACHAGVRARAPPAGTCHRPWTEGFCTRLTTQSTSLKSPPHSEVTPSTLQQAAVRRMGALPAAAQSPRMPRGLPTFGLLVPLGRAGFPHLCGGGTGLLSAALHVQT